MNIDWRRPSVPPISRVTVGKTNEANVEPTNSQKYACHGHISPGNVHRRQLDLSNHSEKSSIQRSVDSIVKIERTLDQIQPRPVCKGSHSLSLELGGSKHTRKSLELLSCTPDTDLLSLGSMATHYIDGMTPSELIKRMQAVDESDEEKPGFIREERVHQKRSSLTLEELADVLCHINTAEACGLPIQWDLIAGVVNPIEHFCVDDEWNDNESADTERRPLPFETVLMPVNIRRDGDGSSISSLSQEGHDFVDDENWESTESFPSPAVLLSDTKMSSTRVLTGARR